MGEVQAEVEAASVDDQETVPEPHVMEEVSLALHVRSQTMDTHRTSVSKQDMD